MVATRQQRALLLDDDKAVVDTLCAVASRIGLETRGETSAKAFLDHAATWEPDFLILDLLMPGCDGVEVIRALAAQTCPASLILISGVGSEVLEAARRTAIERGLKVAGVVPKPVTREKLRRAVDAAPTQAPEVMEGGDAPVLTVDDLRRALDRDEISLVYQPQIACPGGELVGFEALARWHHPERGLIPPDRFIPMAESCELIVPLTETIVAGALDFVAASLSDSEIGISINLSMLNLKDLTFADRVATRCDELGIAPQRITFELTETRAMEDAASALDLLTRLRMKGFGLSIDDFGTGYSSMVQLARLPFTEIKIDRSFVSSALVSAESREVVRSVVALGMGLGLEIVAEGIEDAELLAHVSALGCHKAQGYHIAKPLRADEIATWQSSRPPRATPAADESGDIPTPRRHFGKLVRWSMQHLRQILRMKPPGPVPAMSPDEDRADRRRLQARNLVLIASTIAFFGALIGVVFGIMLGTVTGPEAWIIALCAAVTGGMMVFVYVKPAMATSVVTALLTIYLIFHLNTGSIIAFRSSGDVVRILPYIVWFFPLVVFHQLTNFGFHKRFISLLVGLSPIPVSAYVLAHPTDPIAIGTLDAIVTFLASFFAFVVFVGLFTRHRDEEMQRAALAEEANRTAAILKVSEERFRLLGLATNDLIWDADLKSGQIWWSESLLDTYGYDPRALSNDLNAWETWIHPEDRDRVVESLESVIRNGGSNWSSEYRFVCADGRTLDVVDRGLVLRDDAGAPVRVLGSTTDITELRSLEMKLRQSQKLEAVGQLTGGIAHDFNNLLTIIVGSAETLADSHAENPRVRELAETTLQAAERGANLTGRLLSFARRQALAPQQLRPDQLLTGLEGLIRRTINEDIEIGISAAPDVSPIEADPGGLENAILNLVINARDAMPEGGHLIIEASDVTLATDDLMHFDGMTAGHYMMIAVSDTGCGMPREIAERAFEPFFTTKEVGKGSGLGLSMVWGFVRQSNGHAQIYSEPGMGTTVKLYFPAAARLDAQPPPQTNSVGLAGGTECILVVEDDAMVRDHVTTQLGNLGYRIRQAASAAEALDLMDGDATIDLLFTDVVMPGGMNGKQLADAALLRQPNLKVLYTSGYTEDAIVHHGRLDPGVNLLGKPYRRADLVAKIRHVLDG